MRFIGLMSSLHAWVVELEMPRLASRAQVPAGLFPFCLARVIRKDPPLQRRARTHEA
jgi:hypothetical protein